jgi:RHS (Retrotransposon Hot Spot) family protein
MNPFRASLTNGCKVISISADSDHVWQQTDTKHLFVRSCYNDLWELVAQECFDHAGNIITKGDGFIVSGTPGVGKSCFLDFCLYKLLNMKKTVGYVYGKSGTVRIYNTDGTVQKYKVTDNHEGALAMLVDFLLIDPPENGNPNFLGGKKGLSKKKFILAVSPDRNNCQALRKETSKMVVYMGTCSSEEAEAMRVACYNMRVTKELVASRFDEFGGIPRHLYVEVMGGKKDLALSEVRDQQIAALTDVIKNPNRIDDMENSAPFKSLWTIYHMEPRTCDDDGSVDYSGYTIQPCCQNMETRIRDNLMKKEVRDLWTIFTATREGLGTLRGIRYEAYAHKKILMEGLAVSATGLTQTGLSSQPPKTISIPAGSQQIKLPNNNLREDLINAVGKAMDHPKGGYLLPHLPNFPVVDSIYVAKGNVVAPGTATQLQMKAGRSRPLASDKAARIAEATGSTDLYFIVPDEMFMPKRLSGVNSWSQYRIVLREN